MMHALGVLLVVLAVAAFYFGFFLWLEHLVKRGIEDPNIPRYWGITRTPTPKTPARWIPPKDWKMPPDWQDRHPKSARAMQLYQRRPNKDQGT